eukprot:TRINITY_DN12036_c0_g1_i1.p1 TRINITY_DN12036_c0_g1~~TRINITY_DN12036_c0_g1_i1.p1  ORF type:complete len:364 (-),score=69.28 TRINITY_DN12036_c0_g1_i1:83-1174(-)
MVPFGFSNPLTNSTRIFGAVGPNTHQGGSHQAQNQQQRYHNSGNGVVVGPTAASSNSSSSSARVHSRNHTNGTSIQLLGDWIPKMTDTFIMSRLYTGVDGKANTWRPAQDISRLLTLSKFIELRERIERHRETTDFPSNTKPPLLRYALVAVVKLSQRNPPLLQVTDLPVNAFNHPMMPPCDRLNNDLQPATEQIQNPCVGFQQTKWALTEAGKKWVEENCHKIHSNKRKACLSDSNEVVKLPRIELVPSDKNTKQALGMGILQQLQLQQQTPLQQPSQLQMQQQQQQLSPLLTTALLSSIQTMQERLGLLESLYSTLHQQHQSLQEEHNVLKREHQELQDKVSTAKQMTKLREIEALPPSRQ